MKPSHQRWISFILLLLASAPAVSGQKAVHRSNIPKPERFKIAQEAHEAEIRAEREAKKKYGTPQHVAEQRKMQQTLEERYYFQVCWRHKITHQQLVTIMSESLKASMDKNK